jgi:hypothetical protein
MKLDEIDAEHDVMCVPCGGGAGRGPWGGAFSAQSLRSVRPQVSGFPPDGRGRPLANPQTAASAGGPPS